MALASYDSVSCIIKVAITRCAFYSLHPEGLFFLLLFLFLGSMDVDRKEQLPSKPLMEEGSWSGTGYCIVSFCEGEFGAYHYYTYKDDDFILCFFL